MAEKTISNALVAKLQPAEKHYEIRDATLKGFMVRVNKAGSISYVVQYARGKRITLGSIHVMSATQAREKAAKIEALDQRLQERDLALIEARARTNQHREKRGYGLYPGKQFYGDHLTPAVKVSQHTGLRKGELLCLQHASS